MHLTLLPYLKASGEMKTKPTQQSVGKLREIGVQPHILICRTEKPITEEMREKISLFCNVPKKCVVEERDVDFSIYEVPVNLQREGLDALIADKLRLPPPKPATGGPNALEGPGSGCSSAPRIRAARSRSRSSGKYIQLHDAYKSIYEAITHAGVANDTRVKVRKVGAEDVERLGAAQMLSGARGILVPGGFGERGCRKDRRDPLGAREPHPVPRPLLGNAVRGHRVRTQRGLPRARPLRRVRSPILRSGDPLDARSGERLRQGGTMRLGSYECSLVAGTRIHEIYGKDTVTERHRHRFEFNNQYREAFAKLGLTASGIHRPRNLVEAVEIADHPFFVGVQYHPEFKSRPLEPHPLFREFVKAAVGADTL